MGIEEDDDYINKGVVGIGKKPVPSYEIQNYASYASYASPTYGTRSSGGLQSILAVGAKSAVSARKPSPQRRARPRPSYGATAYSAPAPPPTYNQVSYDSYASTTTQATTTTVTLGFCKMTMYDQTYFRGQSVEITGDLSDFD